MPTGAGFKPSRYGYPRLVRPRPLATAFVLLGLLAGCSFGIGEPAPEVSGGDDVVERSLRDVERFWTREFPRLVNGAAFTPVRGGYFPYTRSDPPPPCGGQA